jgi:hypothetical protein
MANMITVPLQTKTTVTSPTAGPGQDISGTTYGFVSNTPILSPVIYVKVYGLDYGDTATIQIDSSVNAFSNFITHQSWTAYGPIGASAASGDTGGSEGLSTAFPQNPSTFSVSSRDVQNIPWGTSSAVLRVNVSSLHGSSPHVTYEAWMTFSNGAAGVPI